MRAIPLATLLLTTTSLFACTSADEPSTTPPAWSNEVVKAAPSAPVQAPPIEPGAKLPPAHPPLGGGKPLAFAAQDGWVTETPKNAMRKAQYRLPKQGGDTEDATLVVFYFGAGQGGSIQDNIARWTNEYEQPDGKPSSEVAKQTTLRANGMDVVELDVSGTCIAESTPGSGERVRKTNWRTLAAILQSDHGPYFAKLIGPGATVTHWEASFHKFVSSAKPGE